MKNNSKYDATNKNFRKTQKTQLTRLIIEGLMLDTMRQVESHLVTRHYDGFLRKGHLRSRR